MQVLFAKFRSCFRPAEKEKFVMNLGMLVALVSYPFAQGIFYLGLTTALMGWLFSLRNKTDMLSYLLGIPLIKALGLIMVVSAISILYARDRSYALRYWSMIFQAVVTYIILYEVLDSWNIVKLFCFSLMGSGIIISAIALFEYGVGIESRRAVSVFSNPNLLATYLLIVAPLALAQLSRYGIPVAVRIFYTTSFVTGYAGLIMSMSRGGWLGITVAIAVIILMAKNFRLLLIIMLITVLILPLGSDYFFGRLTSVFDIEEHTGRTDIWRGTVNMIRENPFTGVGIGNFRPLYENYAPEGASLGRHHTHNVFLQIIAELGLFGLLVNLIFLGSLTKYVCRLYKKTGGNKKTMIIGIIASLIGFFVHQQVDVTIHDRGIAFYAVFLLAMLGYFYRSQSREKSGEIK